MIEYDKITVANWTRLGMRKAFGQMMLGLAEDYENLLLLTADVANSGNLNDFSRTYPNRFFNVGIAETNMVGVAAGLAKEGNQVFIVTFAPFAAMRPYEAVRTLLGYMHLNVKIVALGSGLSLGIQGSTHYCMEDLCLMRSIPGIAVFSPADCIEEARCLEYLASYEGPAYLRLSGIEGVPSVYKATDLFLAEEPTVIREGKDVVLFATGSIVNECIRVARAMKKEGLTCSVVDVHTIKPLQKGRILEICGKHRMVVSVEEHFANGGLGSILSEIIAEGGNPLPFMRIGIPDRFPCGGGYTFLLDQCGLTAPHIRERILKALEQLKGEF